MNTTLSTFDEARQPLEAVLSAVPADRWADPSPCEGWSARDVLSHIIETQRDFFTGRGLDVGVQLDIDADPAAAWREHAQRVADVVEDDAAVATAYEGFFGPGAGAFGEALHMEGICKPGVDVDPHSDPVTKVLANLGRRA